MSDDDEYKQLLEIQRRNFEAQFGSLEEMGFKKPQESESESGSGSGSESESDEEFAGFSDDGKSQDDNEDEDESGSDNSSETSESEDDSGPVVVKFSESTTTVVPPKRSKLSQKGKIPSLQSIELKEKLKQVEVEAELLKNGGSSKEEKENLQKDIELQRFISESHILGAKNDFSGAELTLRTIDEDPIGKVKAKTMTQRLRSLSQKERKLEKMPMSMRKGMLKKEIERVEQFERDAKEAGTILAKTRKYELRDLNQNRANKVGFKSDLIGTHKIGKKQLKEKFSHRKKGLQIQSLGKSTRNGLRVSESEVAAMIGSNKSRGKGKKGRR